MTCALYASGTPLSEDRFVEGKDVVLDSEARPCEPERGADEAIVARSTIAPPATTGALSDEALAHATEKDVSSRMSALHAFPFKTAVQRDVNGRYRTSVTYHRSHAAIVASLREAHRWPNVDYATFDFQDGELHSTAMVPDAPSRPVPHPVTSTDLRAKRLCAIQVQLDAQRSALKDATSELVSAILGQPARQSAGQAGLASIRRTVDPPPVRAADQHAKGLRAIQVHLDTLRSALQNATTAEGVSAILGQSAARAEFTSITATTDARPAFAGTGTAPPSITTATEARQTFAGTGTVPQERRTHTRDSGCGGPVPQNSHSSQATKPERPERAQSSSTSFANGPVQLTTPSCSNRESSPTLPPEASLNPVCRPPEASVAVREALTAASAVGAAHALDPLSAGSAATSDQDRLSVAPLLGPVLAEPGDSGVSVRKALGAALQDVQACCKKLAYARQPDLRTISVPDPITGGLGRERLDWEDGACIVLAAITDKAVYVAWAGDCEAVIVSDFTPDKAPIARASSAIVSASDTASESNRTGPKDVGGGKHDVADPASTLPLGYVGTQLTQGHWPTVPEERQRIQELAKRAGLNELMDVNENLVRNDRMLGLAVSRSLGDVGFKGLTWANRVATSRCELRPNDLYLVLMSDGLPASLPVDKRGLWPIPNNRSTVWAKMRMQTRHSNLVADIVGPADTAVLARDALLTAARKHRSRDTFAGEDNITAMVVDLRPLARCLQPKQQPPRSASDVIFSDPHTIPLNSAAHSTAQRHLRDHTASNLCVLL
jgi:serine/threonine protein phosphatase PrpC